MWFVIYWTKKEDWLIAQVWSPPLPIKTFSWENTLTPSQRLCAESQSVEWTYDGLLSINTWPYWDLHEAKSYLSLTLPVKIEVEYSANTVMRKKNIKWFIQQYCLLSIKYNESSLVHSHSKATVLVKDWLQLTGKIPPSHSPPEQDWGELEGQNAGKLLDQDKDSLVNDEKERKKWLLSRVTSC